MRCSSDDDRPDIARYATDNMNRGQVPFIKFSEIKYGRTVGQYTFEEFDQLVKDRGMVSEFSPYEFRIEKE